MSAEMLAERKEEKKQSREQFQIHRDASLYFFFLVNYILI